MTDKNIISGDGVRIHYEVHENVKASNTLVFVHGFGGCVRAFDPMITHFKTKYKIINIDLRAHGQSERPKQSFQYHLDCFVNDIALILRNEKAKNVTLIGHCFGGILALNLAINYPKLVKSLVLINVSYKAPHLSRLIYRHFPCRKLIFQILKFCPYLYLKNYPFYAKYEKTGDFNGKRIASDIAHTSLKSYLYISREISSFDLTPQLAKIEQHVLLIHGEKDRVFPVKFAFALNHELKNSKLEIIPKANHLLVLNSNPQLTQIIDKYFQQKFL